MRVVFATLPLPGHAYPLVPLAQALAGAGDEVVFASAEELEQDVRALGFGFATAGPTLRWGAPIALERYPELAALPEPRWEWGSALFVSVLAAAAARDLVPVLERERPDLVVHELYDPGAAVAAAALGIPSVAHGLNRLVPPQMLEDMTARLGEVAVEAGAPAASLFGAAYLDICPPAMQDDEALASAPEVLPLRPRPWSPVRAPLPAELREPRRRPLVYVTLGTVVNTGERALRVFRAVLDGLAALPVDVVVTVGPDGDPAALEPVPENARIERFLPQAELLPHVDAVVHHCGAGTIFGAAAAGVPQLGLPQAADQHFAGAPALAAGGNGRVLGDGELTPQRVAESVTFLLEDEEVRLRARAVADQIARMPAAENVVPRLRELAAR